MIWVSTVFKYIMKPFCSGRFEIIQNHNVVNYVAFELSQLMFTSKKTNIHRDLFLFKGNVTTALNGCLRSECVAYFPQTTPSYLCRSLRLYPEGSRTAHQRLRHTQTAQNTLLEFIRVVTGPRNT